MLQEVITHYLAVRQVTQSTPTLIRELALYFQIDIDRARQCIDTYLSDLTGVCGYEFRQSYTARERTS